MNEEFEKMRAEFEAWLQPYWSRESYLDSEGDRIYREEWVQGAWIGWQASRKQALSEAANKCDEWATQLTAYDSAKCATAETCAEIIREMQKD